MVEQIIMRSGTQASNNLNFESIIPRAGKSFQEQVQNCIDQLSSFIYPEGEPRYFITQQTFFIKARTREEYEERSSYITGQLSRSCGALQPATSIVAQPPVTGSEVVLELICTRTQEGKKVLYKSIEGINYTVVQHKGFKVVHATGLMGDRTDSIQAAAEKAFDRAIQILDEEKLSIDHIIRQWNYVEQIARIDEKDKNLQNYQVFNDVRTKYYERGTFKLGYPAATGIGMTTGGVIIGFIAVSDSDDVVVKPIRNPRQIDAHQYSREVLRGTETGITTHKCTPKFERGKMVSLGERNHIYVSGTASIVGEKTLHPGDVEQQTITTIENIYQLFSKENQAELGLDFEIDQIEFSHLRVYVKYQKDIPAVEKICESKLNCKSSLYLESDVCREDLLVEIEGIFTLPGSAK
jgi:enamine deaminase RidA (YjgF/YER057c/UK114 family)